MRTKCNFKKLDATLWFEYFPESCLDIVTTYSFCFETSAEKSPWTKIYCMENCLSTSIFTRIWSIIFSCKFFRYFQQAFNSSAQLKDRELWMLVLFLLIIPEMHSLVALECAACVCFLRKLWVWEKIHSKFVKPWKMKNLLWDHENGSETVWRTVKPWELRGLYLTKFDDVI